jgi:microsomal dipeptidase-like Zn-dependent dipeptidase
VIGLTVATTWPDVNGSLSRWLFRSLGLQPSAVHSRMAIANWVIERIESWCDESGGDMLVVGSVGDLERCLAPGGPVGVLLGVQGAHVLDGNLANVALLRERGVRMFALSHVMDNEVVGSGTGRKAGGLSDFGREVIAELEAQGLIVDLAHMSDSGVEQTMPLLTRPFTMSHAAIRDASARPGSFRRYSAATRNVPESVARDIGVRGGLFGVVMATQLLGGTALNSAVRMIRRALDAACEQNVAIGSDMDGALKMLIDCEGLPALADTMLAAGMRDEVVANVIGGNAARFLKSALPA